MTGRTDGIRTGRSAQQTHKSEQWGQWGLGFERADQPAGGRACAAPDPRVFPELFVCACRLPVAAGTPAARRSNSRCRGVSAPGIAELDRMSSGGVTQAGRLHPEGEGRSTRPPGPSSVRAQIKHVLRIPQYRVRIRNQAGGSVALGGSSRTGCAALRHD